MWHHVMNHGVADTPIFTDAADREHFLDLLGEISCTYGIEVHVQCLMGNHFHLQIRSTLGRISDAMRDLTGQYARWFNRRHGRRGALFQGRFQSVIINDDDQLVTTWIYIHRNPAGIGVDDLIGYRWSSAAAYAGSARPPPWLHVGTLTRIIGADQIRRLLTRCDPN